MTTDDPHRDSRDDPWAPASQGARPPLPRRRALLVVAILLFTVGVGFTVLAAVTPFVLGRDAPTILYVGAMLFTPVGFLLGLLYAIIGARPPRV